MVPPNIPNLMHKQITFLKVFLTICAFVCFSTAMAQQFEIEGTPMHWK
jgi:hypothetical protein